MDCFDTCEAIYENEKVRPSKSNFFTNGKLCENFAHLLNEKKLEQSYFNKKEIPLSQSLGILIQKLKDTNASEVLYYKGSGNLGIMQSSVKTFFSRYGAVLTKGSLCDEMGAFAFEEGRGHNLNPSIERLLQCDVIVVWGRNLTVTSSHMYKILKDKTFITIDPIQTPIAKKSKIHLQLNPKSDASLALALSRFAYMNDLEDEKYLDNLSDNWEDFIELSNEKPLLEYEKETGVSLTKMSETIDLLKDKKVAFLVGLGAGKYFEGVQIMRTIDSCAAYLGVHKEKNGGVWFLANSTYGYENYFKKEKTTLESMPSVDFKKYDVVFIQGANPVMSAPNKNRIIEGLKKSFVIYFGTTYNETCEYADLIIPSTNFLAKKDIRLSYGNSNKIISNPVIAANKNTTSEYELAQKLNESFGFEVFKSEDEIINDYANKTVTYPNPLVKTFNFIDTLEIEPLLTNKQRNEFNLITVKYKSSLNSQFKVNNFAHLNTDSSFKHDDKIMVSSKYGKAEFIVKTSDEIKENCVLFYSGCKNANILMPHESDELSNNAMFQEVIVNIDLS